MPDRKEGEAGEFKVVDRRLFTSDGQRRPDAPVESPKAEAPPAKPPKAEPPATPPKPGTPPPQTQPEVHGPVQLEHLIMSLVTTAMYQMGLAVRPGEVAPPPDLLAAQETIQLLDILQQKTKGNLTKEEEQLLTNGLYELRMVFVEL
ncbi:MAG: DUF1844 domain-containing protein, partial [Acidobacteria bacterium]|nr:DUF1844 domain-containing protein [Acidobacteriota bacterium]